MSFGLRALLPFLLDIHPFAARACHFCSENCSPANVDQQCCPVQTDNTMASTGFSAPAGICYFLLDIFTLKILSACAESLLKSWGNFLSPLYVNTIKTVSNYLHNFRVLWFYLPSSPFSWSWDWGRIHIKTIKTEFYSESSLLSSKS